MVKGYCHAHVVELRILHWMAKLGYKSKENLDTLCKKPKRLGRKQMYGFDGGGQAPFEFLINSRIPIGNLFYWVKGAPPMWDSLWHTFFREL